MSLNTANTSDGRGVIIYNGEIILLFVREVNLSFENFTHPDFKGTKKGNLYLTSHRIIFNNTGEPSSNFKSISMPFIALRNIKLEQPIFGANYLTGDVIAQPNGNWEGEAKWKLTFNRGGCIDFGQALLKSEEMAQTQSRRPFDAPPMYAPPAGAYYSAPPAYYWTNGNNNGYQAPTHTFPEQPPPESVFMYEQPPPYPGMGPVQQNPPPPGFIPQGGGGQPQQRQGYGAAVPSAPAAPPYPARPAPSGNLSPYPTLPPSYDQATALPQKAHMD